jgi:fucose 4-O-acetylase-like acetyltransferase
MHRLYFVQWLRVFLISLVVAHHAAQPYGPTGGEWPLDDPANAEWLGAFFSLNAAFFMGFFFLIAGYFTGSSYDRKGGTAFVRDRLIRLGIPLAFFTFVVFPPVTYAFTDPPGGFVDFYLFTYIGRWHLEMAQLWFIAQLLACGLIYAAFRWIMAQSGRTEGRIRPAPGDVGILVYAIALALVGAAARTQFEQDDWVRLLWLVPAEPAHLPQYVSLFVIGIVAGRGNWFEAVTPGMGWRWLAVGFAAFAASRIVGGGDPVWGIFEAFVCVGLIVGLLYLFRRFADRPGRWLDRLDQNVYGVYIIHIFVVVGLQLAILDFDWPATVKFLAVTAVGLPLCFAISAALRAIPIVRAVV